MLQVGIRARDLIRLVRALPALALIRSVSSRPVIARDVRRWVECLDLGREDVGFARQVAWLLAAWPEFRNLFYYRLGVIPALLLRPLYRPVETLVLHVGSIGPG